jgi:tetratricopeptide (TPR) repeat protein
MLEQAARRYEGFIKLAGDDAPLQLEAARTWLRLGNIRRTLLAPKDAIEAYRSAAKMFAKLLETSPTVTAQEGLARTNSQLALAYAESGDLASAEQHHQQGIEVLSAALGKLKPEQLDERRELELALSDVEINYGNSLAQRGQMAKSADRYRDVINRLERLSREDAGDIETRISLATAMLGLGQVTSKLGDTETARNLFQRAATYLNAAAQLTDETPRLITLTANAGLMLAISNGQLGDYAAEAEAYGQIIDAYRRLDAQLPNVPSVQNELARVLIDLGQTLIKLGDLDSSQTALQEAKHILEKLKAAHPSVAPFQEAYALALDHLSTSYAIEANADEARASIDTALVEFRALVEAWPDIPEYRLRTATTESHFGLLLFTAGKPEEAKASFEQAEDRLAALIVAHPDDPAIRYAAATVASRWAEMLYLAGDAAGAEQQATVAKAHYQRLVELSEDAEYLAAAAWHFLTCPAPGLRDSSVALSKARASARQSPKNGYYSVICALAELRQDKAATSLEILEKFSPAINDTFTKIASLYVKSLALAAMDDKDAATAAYEQGVKLAEAAMAGSWELATLRRECEAVLKPDR